MAQGRLLAPGSAFQLGAEPDDLVFELDDHSDTGETDAEGRELNDPGQKPEIVVGVESDTSLRPRRGDEAETFIGPQGLWMSTKGPGGDADYVERHARPAHCADVVSERTSTFTLDAETVVIGRRTVRTPLSSTAEIAEESTDSRSRN